MNVGRFFLSNSCGLYIDFDSFGCNIISNVHIEFFSWVKFCSRKEISSCVQSSCDVCYDKVALKYIVAGVPEGRWYYFSLEEACYWTIICENEREIHFPTSDVRIQKTQNKLQMILLRILTFWFELHGTFLTQMRLGNMLSFWIGVFGWDDLQKWWRSQLL